MSPWPKYIIPAFLVGCLAGGFFGARAQKAAFHRFAQKGFNTERVISKFTRELDLDAKQQESVKGIVSKHHEKMMSLHKQRSAQFSETRLAMREEIKKLLTPEQQGKFAAMLARWDARRKGREGPAPVR